MTFDEAIDSYVNQRKLEGIGFVEGAACLKKFSLELGNISLSEVSTAHIINVLDRCGASKNARQIRIRLLVQFFNYWAVRGVAAPSLGMLITDFMNTGFLPYVYKKSEVCILLQSTGACQSHSKCAMSATTFRMLLLLLYATGATSSELRRIKRRDVLLGAGFIFLENTRSGSRKIPLSRETQEKLKCFMKDRFRKPITSQYLFVTKQNNKLNRDHLSKAFARLCKIAGVRRLDGQSHAPRIQDFRTTFAVHRTSAWILDGSNLNELLPALAVYMGHRSLLSGQNYLRMTPERFQKQLDALSV